MGCAQSRPSTTSPSRGLEKLKLDRGYVKAGKDRSSNKPTIRREAKDNKIATAGGDAAKRSGRARGGGENKAASRGVGKERTKSKSDGNGGNDCVVSDQRLNSKKINGGGGDDLVDGWPKWLLDNVNKDALAGLVPKTADSYDKLAKVGHGTYSNVYKARDRDTGKIVALKKVRFDTTEPESVKFMAREIMILQKLDHPNVIKLEGIATSRMQYSLYLVFDFMQCDLTRIICRPGSRLSEPQVKCYMHQLLSGLRHCHKKGILHRDIKASNLLIDKSGMLKIADFGLANFFNPNEKRPLTSRVVTLWYRAPELLLGSTDYGVGIDLWSAGCLLAEMFLGRPFMPGKTEVEQLHKIFKFCGAPSEEYWKRNKLQSSYRPPQHYQPSYRETFKDFPCSSFGLLTKLLALDPAYRGTAASALENDFFSSSPPACDLSGLPALQIEEPPPSHQAKNPKRRKSTRAKQLSRTNVKAQDEGAVLAVEAKRDSESSREALQQRDLSFFQEKIAETSFKSQEATSNSMSSASFSLKPNLHEDIIHVSLSPVLRSNGEASSSRTEGHPNAARNIQNYSTLLQASITDIINPKEGNQVSHFRRSLSTLDFRHLDPEKMSKLFGVEY
ncbi:probable serine/threonine-protein kinase At1g54610 [Rhodamnia argentea]|uniref:Probable serine/threonine-protein kinase At1g54610 n=1 Tax=Rhodamnia argentea TaxID=178133 RepID=A0ABM3HCP2_9MYRT|nr:probable serine/threonine-protein kinase At1g54610 [Rhodamnia argentea]